MRTRGALLVAGACGIGAAAWWTAWHEPRRLIVRERELTPPGWPAALDGLRVGLLSDLHAGLGHTGPARVEQTVALLNDQRPDVVCLLGDFLDSTLLGKGRADPDVVARALAGLRAPLGRYAVLGNHDWRAAGPAMGDALYRAGVPVLENEAVDVVAAAVHASGRTGGAGGDGAGEAAAGGGEGGVGGAATGACSLWVAGTADLRTRVPDLRRTLAAVPDGAPVLLMVHDPDVFLGVPSRVALTVAGHTHGAQVDVPLLRLLVIPSRHGTRYLGGLVVEHGRLLYVTTGVGTAGLPVRFRRPPEVVVLTLRALAGRAGGSAPRSRSG